MSDVRYSSLVLSAAIVAVYLGQQVFPSLSGLSFVAATFLEEPWTILTAVVLHDPGDYMHPLNNLFFLAVFGFMLENIVGTRKFLALFAGAGILANLSAFIFYPAVPVLGASGAVSGIVAALAVIRPRDIGLFWGVPVPMWAALLGWVATNLAGAAATGGGIAFEAHLFGLAAGAAFGLFERREHSRSRAEEHEIDVDVEEWEERFMR